MKSDDPFELLSRLRPADLDRPVEPGENPSLDAMLRDVTAAARPQPGRVRRRWIAATLAGAVIVGGGAVAASVLLGRPSDPTTLSCYSDASVDPDIQVGLPIDPDLTPEEQCAPLWWDGPLGTDGPPPLTGCVTDSGITAVIPGDQGTCTEIGMVDRDPATDVDSDAPTRVVNALSERFTEAGCVTTMEAVDLVRAALDEFGPDGWDVEVERETSRERPCATPTIDAENEVVRLVASHPEPVAP